MIETIKEQLKAKATIFRTGGFSPKNEMGESWIGKVSYKKENEELPIDKDGNKMGALAMLFIDDLNTYPTILKGKYLMTVFISYELLDHYDDNEGYYCIRLYDKNYDLVPCDWKFFDDGVSFPLSKEFVDNDYPNWGELSFEMAKKLTELEEEKGIDYYDDIFEENYCFHKIGGHPSYIQDAPEDEDFVFQITSDEKLKLNIVDGGNLYFSYKNGNWHLYWDFY